MIGGTFAENAVFCVPGVPPSAAVDGSQFWPLSLLINGFLSSNDLTPVSAVDVQSYPPNVPSRMRVPQSPWGAYVTEFTVSQVPGNTPGLDRVTFSPLFARDEPASHGP